MCLTGMLAVITPRLPAHPAVYTGVSPSLGSRTALQSWLHTFPSQLLGFAPDPFPWS